MNNYLFKKLIFNAIFSFLDEIVYRWGAILVNGVKEKKTPTYIKRNRRATKFEEVAPQNIVHNYGIGNTVEVKSEANTEKKSEYSVRSNDIWGFMRVTLLAIFAVLIIGKSENVKAEPCIGKFVNPITDICWSCIFPVKIGNTSIYSGGREDTKNSSKIPCICDREIAGVKVPTPGIPISFWEPVRLADVTRTPYCMVSLGGFQLMKSVKKHGAVARKGGNEALKHSFYHIHWYIYPLIYWLELVTDFMCLEQTSVDVAYLSEFDPLWNNDELNAIMNPEAMLFGNPVAQLACGADCMKVTTGFSADSLFWCAGCNGSLYPFSGTIEHHVGGVQASTLTVERTMARLHRTGLAWDTVSNICKKQIAPKIKKTQYKLQMTFPIANSKGKMACNPFGRTTSIWGSGREIPGNGEDFGYLIWRKKRCCLL